MRYLRKPAIIAALAAGAFGVAQSATAESQPSRNYVVVYEQGQSAKAAHEAIAAAGGKLVKENAKIGVATVASKDPAFIRQATAQRALLGAAHDRPIGHTPADGHARWQDIERAGQGTKGKPGKTPAPAPADEPLAGLQWDMRMIDATPQGSYRYAAGLQGGPRRHHRHGRRRLAPRHRAELRLRAVAQLHHRQAGHRRPVRRRARPLLHGSRRPSTRTATARTSPARSAPRSTASASPASPRRSTSSTSAAARTRATSSCSRRSTRSPTRATTASTS